MTLTQLAAVADDLAEELELVGWAAALDYYGLRAWWIAEAEENPDGWKALRLARLLDARPEQRRIT